MRFHRIFPLVFVKSYKVFLDNILITAAFTFQLEMLKDENVNLLEKVCYNFFQTVKG